MNLGLPPKKVETRGRKKKIIEKQVVSPIVDEPVPIVLNIQQPKTRKNKNQYVSNKPLQKNIIKRKLIIEPDE